MQLLNINKPTKKIIMNSFWMVFDKIFILLLNVFVTVKVANHYGTDIYGTYQYAVSIIAIFEILTAFLDARVTKKNYSVLSAESIVFNSTLIKAFLSLLTFVIGVIFIFISKFDKKLSVLLLILLFDLIVRNLRFGIVNRFEYELKAKRTTIASDVAALLGSVLQLIAVMKNADITYISLIALLTSFVNLTILVVQYKVIFKGDFKQKVDYSFIKEALKESFPLALAASCATIYTKCDSVMLGTLISTAEVGIYSIAIKLMSVVQILINPIRESVYPKLLQLHNDDPERYEDVYVKISSLLSWIYIIGIAFSFVVLPFVFSFIKPEYSDAMQVFKIYSIGSFFMYNAALRAGHLTTENNGYILLVSQVLSVVLNLGLNLLLINQYGMYGAAIATSITQFISLFVSNLLFKKTRKTIFIWQLKALNPVYAVKLMHEQVIS